MPQPGNELLAEHAGPVLEVCIARFADLLPDCPERRDLVHGDLLHQNVLLSAAATSVSGIFSWKCSALGDFLYDVAWCTLWGRWHPVIGATDVWERTLDAQDLSVPDLHNAAIRHHCYELHIAATHMGWFVKTGETEALRWLLALTQEILDRGPRQV